MPNNVAEILREIVGNLKDMAKSESVMGQPVTLSGKTIMPVISISLGFGAGGGQQEEQAKTGFGGGGGGGLRIETTAFIIIDENGVSLLPAKKGSWENIIHTIPGVIEKLAKSADNIRSARAADRERQGGPGEQSGGVGEGSGI